MVSTNRHHQQQREPNATVFVECVAHGFTRVLPTANVLSSAAVDLLHCVRFPLRPLPAAIKVINGLHRNKLIYHERKVYDGYRLTYLGYDFLALHTYVARGLITALGRRIGVGKEADIYECANEKGESMVIKLHRSVNQNWPRSISAHMTERDDSFPPVGVG